MLRWLHILLCVVVVLLSSGCSDGDEQDTAVIRRVLLVYIGGDNNLSGEAIAKIDAVTAGWSGKPSERVLIYADIYGRLPQILEVVNDKGTRATKLIASYASENSASPDVFARVIDDVKRRYRADKYGLLVFSHASGWLPEGRLNNPVQSGDDARISAMTSTYAGSRSIIMDGRSEMELLDFAAAIPDKAFDYIVFEACFMSGIEVAYQLRDKCDYILASSAEIVAPGFTDIYPASINSLLSGDPQSFGSAVFDRVLSYSANDYHRSATYSLIRTAGLGELAAFVRDNCNLEQQVDINALQHFDRVAGAEAPLFFDFEDYYSRLLATGSQRDELSRLVDACVKWKASTPTFLPTYSGFTIERHSGLTAYILQPTYAYLNARYRYLDWHEAIKH